MSDSPMTDLSGRANGNSQTTPGDGDELMMGAVDLQTQIAAHGSQLPPGSQLRWERIWRDLELEPPSDYDRSNFRHQVMRRVRQCSRPDVDHFDWTLAPVWARLLAAVALTLGLGSGLAISNSSPEPLDIADLEVVDQPISLAESYWLALEQSAQETPSDPTFSDPWQSSP